MAEEVEAMTGLVTEKFVEGLRALADDVQNRIDSLRRKIAAIESDRANIVAMLHFQEEIVHGSDYLPHISVRRLFKGNELRDCCFDALSKSAGVLDTRELARACMRKKGMDSEDILIRKKVVYSVMQAMRTARRRGVVENCGLRKGVLLWRLRQSVSAKSRQPNILRS